MAFMAAVPVASLIGLGLAGVSAVQANETAKTELVQAELAAKQEELAVVQREGDRKDRLASALASQNALTGASGIALFEGSPLTILNDSIERESVATERDQFGASQRALAIRSQARIKSRSRRVGAALNLGRSVGNVSQQVDFSRAA